MYILVFLSMLIFSSLCNAGKLDYACLDLQIAIKNNTPNTCYLLTEEIGDENTFITHGTDVSFKILPNEQSSFATLTPRFMTDGVSMELLYECGEGYYIRLDSQKNPCSYKNTAQGRVLYAANLTATTETVAANYWSNKPAKIVWTIQ